MQLAWFSLSVLASIHSIFDLFLRTKLCSLMQPWFRSIMCAISHALFCLLVCWDTSTLVDTSHFARHFDEGQV